jgi:hypothetical protein
MGEHNGQCAFEQKGQDHDRCQDFTYSLPVESEQIRVHAPSVWLGHYGAYLRRGPFMPFGASTGINVSETLV